MLPLQLLPASLLLSQENRRVLRLRRHHCTGSEHDPNAAARNNSRFFATGCRELDSHVLLGGGLGLDSGNGGGGGFEAGSVVGISSEEEDTIGLGVGLQVIARMLLLSQETRAKAMIITMLSTTSLLPRLRLALVSEAKVLLQANAGDEKYGGKGVQQVDRAKIKSCLERVLVARVFDAEGLREVLRELEQQTVAPHTPPSTTLVTEDGIQQEEGQHGKEGGGKTDNNNNNNNNNNNRLPSLILITNTSHLLNTLFTHHHGNKSAGSDKPRAAHNSAVELSDQIRALSKRGPLVMLLNSTTSNLGSGSMFDDNRGQGAKQSDLSIMRSIFNPSPPPPPPAAMEGAPGYWGGSHAVRHGHVAGVSVGSYRPGQQYQSQNQNQNQAFMAAAAVSRRNKPSYGMVFSQMLDLHLLCTKVSRGKARLGGGYGGYIWAVEVLLDELGVYEGLETYLDGVGDGKRKKRLTRRSREQRWGAVEIEEGSGRVVDAFR